MSTAQQRRALELLRTALELSPDARLAFLDEACASPDEARLRRQVEELLDLSDDVPFLERPVFDVHAEASLLGRSIGPYLLIRELGRGGMGTVFLARREDLGHEVALKLIRHGLELDQAAIRRFDTERRILARLRHPHIAVLFDGGTTEGGLPWFAMEHVDGEPIDRWCDAQQASLRARLELILKICQAVQHIHQHMVIHRDLKPSNILVAADGEPKVLDFGIAKLLDTHRDLEDRRTLTVHQPRTVRYASPEQVADKAVSAASDVYALGVLLYELLAGDSPYRRATGPAATEAALLRAILGDIPEPPSAALLHAQREVDPNAATSWPIDPHRLRGDLDSVVLKALAKDPHERYGSAFALAEDLQRYLDGLPVTAHRTSTLERARRFVGHHRVAFATATTFLLLLLSASLVMTLLWHQAQRGQERAEEASQFLESLILNADPNHTDGKDLTVRELIGSGIDQVESDLADAPELRADMAGVMGQVLFALDDLEKAEILMRTALSAALASTRGEHPEVAKRMTNLAVVLHRRGAAFWDESETLFREALDIQHRAGLAPRHLFRTQNGLAGLLLVRGACDEALALFEEVLEARQTLYEPTPSSDDADVTTSLRNVGTALYVCGDPRRPESLNRAGELLAKAIARARRSAKPRQTFLAGALEAQGNALAALGRSDLARGILEEALEIRQRVLGADHLVTAQAQTSLASVLLCGAPDRAANLLRAALNTLESKDPQGWKIARTRSVLGELLACRGRLEEACVLLESAAAKLEELRGELVIFTRRARQRLAVCKA